ncbi:hypothetical protein QFC21_003931 [Naganishia friedmannii]|uniref:Uncharacterized protein n=1 Tax=Naganishia friedmannii TaxID=89922 RepID=A0ACC2VMR4_9TREE|nr:hypothetical protein QFC21_003931 [Naganishia friedmannii]
MTTPTYTPLQLIPPLPPTPYDPVPFPTTLAFDPYADLLDVGTSAGTVVTYSSPLSLTQHVTYPAHGAKNFSNFMGFEVGEVREIMMTEREVCSLTPGGVGGRTRGGIARWSATDPQRGLKTFTSNPVNSHELVAGGKGMQMMLVNTARGEIVTRLDISQSLNKLISLPKSILALSSLGHINLLDPRQAFKVSSVISLVSPYFTDSGGMDVQGNTVVRYGCKWTADQQILPDSTIMLYDMRNLKSSAEPTTTLDFPPGAAFVKIHPMDPSKLVAVSAQGLVRTLDMHGRETGAGNGYDAAGTDSELPIDTYATSCALSLQGDYLAIGDAEGQVHLTTSHDMSESSHLLDQESGMLKLPPMNGFSHVGNSSKAAVDWPDAPMELPRVHWTDQTPLNIVGMPYYDTPLLSNFSLAEYATASSPIFHPPAKIPTSILSSMRVFSGVGYAVLPKEMQGKRNVVCKSSKANLLVDRRGKFVRGDAAEGGDKFGGDRRESGPRFRSEKSRAGNEAVDDPSTTPTHELTIDGKPAMPRHYRKVEIKYSRFGVEDFDFEFYNKTNYSGLETHISNSYTNSLLQALHYTLPIRIVAKAHIAQECEKESCLLCESGFLFRMLEDAKGINCQASNFSRAFSSSSQASMLGLLVAEDNQEKVDYASLIQKFNRWLMTAFASEDTLYATGIPLERGVENLSLHDGEKTSKGSESSASIPPLTQVSALKGVTKTECMSCHATTRKDFLAHVVDLVYPRPSTSPRSQQNKHAAFSEIVQNSLIRHTSVKNVCSSCKRNANLISKRTFAENGVLGLPAVISLNAAILSKEHRDSWKSKATPWTQPAKRFLPKYLKVKVDAEGSPKVSESDALEVKQGDTSVYGIRSIIVAIEPDGVQEGHLVAFVRVSTDDESEPRWVLFNDFAVREVSEEEALDFDPDWKIPATIMLERINSHESLNLNSLTQNIDPSILLRDVCISKRRDPSMIKHVNLRPDEIPKPGTLIAIDAEFVSLQLEELEIRSDGTKKVLRPTKMSLARVSVLRGDGENEESPFIDDYIHTSEKVVDYLTEYSGINVVDLGCVFIGHGLPKDFRTINIFVPPEQVVDTVILYYEPARHRKLSLRFLAWFLLKQDIQLAEHDSIEDARSALLLYKKYLDFIEEGRFKDVMEDIFDAGKRLGFKPPQSTGVTSVTNSPLPSAPSTPDIAEARLASNSLYPSNPSVRGPGTSLASSQSQGQIGASPQRHGRLATGWSSNNMNQSQGNRRPNHGMQNGNGTMGAPGQPVAPAARRWR